MPHPPRVKALWRDHGGWCSLRRAISSGMAVAPRGHDNFASPKVHLLRQVLEEKMLKPLNPLKSSNATGRLALNPKTTSSNSNCLFFGLADRKILIQKTPVAHGNCKLLHGWTPWHLARAHSCGQAGRGLAWKLVGNPIQFGGSCSEKTRFWSMNQWFQKVILDIYHGLFDLQSKLLNQPLQMRVSWRWLSACLCTTLEKISLEYLEGATHRHNLKKGQNWPHKDGVKEPIQYHLLIPSSQTIFKFNTNLFIQMSCVILQPPCCSLVSPVLLQELALSWREDVQVGMQRTVHFFTNLQKGKEGRFGGSTLCRSPPLVLQHLSIRNPG